MTFDSMSGHAIFSGAIKRAAAWIAPVDEADPVTRGLGRTPACLAGPKPDTRRSCPAQVSPIYQTLAL